MFVAKDKLKIGDKIELELNLPPFGNPVRAIAQVMYIIKNNDQINKWRVGARFIELGEPSIDRILDYVEYIKKTAKKLRKA